MGSRLGQHGFPVAELGFLSARRCLLCPHLAPEPGPLRPARLSQAPPPGVVRQACRLLVSALPDKVQKANMSRTQLQGATRGQGPSSRCSWYPPCCELSLSPVRLMVTCLLFSSSLCKKDDKRGLTSSLQ